MNSENIRMGRAALNWSLDQLAKESGVHRNTIANIETGKSAGAPATVAAIRRTLETFGVIFSDVGDGNMGNTLRRFQVGDLVRFRAQSRVPDSYRNDIGERIIGTDELGTVVWVESAPHLMGPTYMIEVQFERTRVPRMFKFEYELVRAATDEHVAPPEPPVVTTNVSQEDVKAFCAICESLLATRHHFQILFEEGGELRRELLQQTSPFFFNDLNEMLIEHLILQICKITDPEESFGRKNLTINFLISNSDFSNAAGELQELGRLNKSIQAFREKILPARHKLISHIDRGSVLAGKSLGGTDQNSWDQFWRDLEEFTRILHRRYVDPDFDYRLNEIALLSDADSLVKAIKESTYFWTLLKDTKFTEKCADVALGSKYSEA